MYECERLEKVVCEKTEWEKIIDHTKTHTGFWCQKKKMMANVYMVFVYILVHILNYTDLLVRKLSFASPLGLIELSPQSILFLFFAL